MNTPVRARTSRSPVVLRGVRVAVGDNPDAGSGRVRLAPAVLRALIGEQSKSAALSGSLVCVTVTPVSSTSLTVPGMIFFVEMYAPWVVTVCLYLAQSVMLPG